MTRRRIALATCAEWPEPSGDAPLRDALEERGHDVAFAPWNGPSQRFEEADLVILRACWDYWSQPEAFSAWLDALEANGTPVLNPLPTVRWNFDKRYLLQLADAGVDVVPTVVVDAADEAAARSAMAERGWPVAIRKPVTGQSGHQVDRLEADDDRWPEATFSGPALLQAFQADISEVGETLLVFFEGEYSHSLRRELPAGEWRSNSQYGSRRVRAEVDPKVIAKARDVIAKAGRFVSSGQTPLYARVDGLVRGDRFTLMELELIEPALGFEVAPDGAERFAAAIDRSLARSTPQG